jgi:hypothetical protein
MGPGAVIRKILSIAGYSLSFGLRRMETILRVAWLPVALLLVFSMAEVFVILSIAAGRPLSFGDYPTFVQATQELAMYSGLAWGNNENLMYGVTGGFMLVQYILIASFMAPLTRYAGLGEVPSPGAMKLPFGMDQVRFIVGYFLSFLVLPALLAAPIALSAPYVVEAVDAVMKVYYASFPDPESLHTVEIIPAPDYLDQQGKLWYYLQGVPLAAAAPLALLFWFVLFRHFRPRDRRGTLGGATLRALLTFGASAGLALFLWQAYISKTPEDFILAMAPTITRFFPEISFEGAKALVTHVLVLLPVVIGLVAYGNLRALPYSGVAVCRRSFSLAGTGRVTRGWKLIWVILALAIVWVFTIVVQAAMNIGIGFIGSSLNTLLFATQSATRIVNSGETGAWVYPAFVTTWNLILILANILWIFFSYGVFAGLLGRLYRESESGG